MRERVCVRVCEGVRVCARVFVRVCFMPWKTKYYSFPNLFHQSIVLLIYICLKLILHRR